MTANARLNSPAFGDLPPAPPELSDPLCIQFEPEMFFPHPHASTQADEAKSICRQCPVAMSCLIWSLQLHAALPYGLEGVWAGLTHAERRRFLDEKRRVA